MNELRIDESRGDLLRQAVNSAPGYGDQILLRKQRELALSPEAPIETRRAAARFLAEVAFTYGAPEFGELIQRRLQSDTRETQ